MAEWDSVPIGDLCDVVNGGTPKTGVPDYWGGPHSWITPAEMGKRSTPYIDQTARTITDRGLQDSSARLLPPCSVILSSRAPIGHVVINTNPMATNQGCKGLIPRSRIDHKFLYYYLGNIVDLLNWLGTGTTFKELSGGKLKEVKVPVPPMAEQRCIVAILDEAFEGIATAKTNAEKNLRNARALFEQHHQAVFSALDEDAVVQRLGDFASFRNGINYTKQSNGQMVQIVGVKDFQNHFWAPLDELDSVRLDGDLGAADRLAEGDILTVRSNGNPELVGRCMVVGQLPEPVTHSGFTIKIRLNTSIALPTYVCQFMRCRAVRRELIDGGNGLNIKSLNQGMLSEVTVPLPTIDKQREVVAKIESMSLETSRLADVISRKLAALDELKKSLLHQAFTGQLTSSKPVAIARQAARQTTTPEFAANVIALAHARHERQRRDKSFGHVKAQKVLHLTESIAKIDLGRFPIKDAAGPNDFQHMLKAEDWARANKFFEMVKRGDSYEFRKLSAFDERMSSARQALAPFLGRLERVIDLLVPMDKLAAEVFATVHAAWNNLLIDGVEVTDDAIVSAAREAWHADKLKIEKNAFRTAIALIRQKGVVPDGSGKYVGGQQSLL